VNPYGVGLWRFLWRTVGVTRPDITEWQPVWSAPVGLAVLWAGVLALAAAVVTRRVRLRPAYLAILALLAAGSFLVNRLVPFFGIAAVYWLAPSLGSKTGSAAVPAARQAARGFAAVWLSALVLIVAAGGITVAVTNRCVTPSNGWQPPDGEAVRFIKANHLSGRMVTWFDWGEHAIWHLGPAVRVSMDGRRETVYSERVLAGHRSFYANEPAGIAYVESLDPDYLWLPATLAAARTLETRGWRPIFRSGGSVVLARRTVAPAVPAPLRGPGCFPAA
jgi:hypothetical protein